MTSDDDRPSTPFMGLAEVAAQWMPPNVAVARTASPKQIADAPAPTT